MPLLRTYNIFISHMWRNRENSEYYLLERMLDNANYFSKINYSVPEHDPLQTRTNKELLAKLRERIKPIHCFLIISGMYANHRQWIEIEIDIAKEYNKPIIGIEPRGQERVPIGVQAAAIEMVKWNTDSIISAIRRHSKI